MSALPIGIIADDLTGAADTAAAAARPGSPVAVSLDGTPRGETRSAFAVTTDSRSRPPVEAYGRARASVGAACAAGAGMVYKKVDSNLRGDVGAEVAAAGDVVGRPVLLAPAFPGRGRTTVGGVALVHGVPVAETEMARDPEAPVITSDVAALLRAQRDGLRVRLCPLSVVREGEAAIRAAVPDGGVLVLDAETDADLDVIAQAALSIVPLPALAGSAGLAAALARRLLGPASRRHWPKGRRGPSLAVLASSSETLVSQIACAAEDADLHPIPFRCGELTRDDEPVPELRGVMQAAIGELREGRDAIVYACGPLPRVERPVELIVEHLAHLAFVVVKEAGPLGLLVGGGSTAQAVLEALGTEVIDVDDEPLPGIAAGLARARHFADGPVVLKPGAAGDAGAVVGLLEYLGRRAAAAREG